MWDRLSRHWLLNTFQGIVGSTFVAVSLIIAVFGRWLAPYSPSAVDLSATLAGPSSAHWFGTDDVGRDLLSRVLVGAGYTLLVALGVVASAFVVGSVVGAFAGYVGGRLGNVIMRVTDFFLSYPGMLLAIAVAAALGQGLFQSAIAIGVGIWAAYARLTQVQAAAVRGRLFMDAARMSGSSMVVQLVRHMIPNALSPVLVKATMDVALCVEWIAALGFVGLGAQPPTPEWGSMIAQSQNFLLNAWWFPLFPCLGLVVMVLGFNLLGDALDQHLYGGRPLSRRAIRQFEADMTVTTSDMRAVSEGAAR